MDSGTPPVEVPGGLEGKEVEEKGRRRGGGGGKQLKTKKKTLNY